MRNELRGFIVNHKPISESTLKRLLLIFDKITFLDPIENLHLIPQNDFTIKMRNLEIKDGDYGALYNGISHMKTEEDLLDSFDYAIHKGIINVVNLKARKFYENNSFQLKLAYAYDNSNAELLNNFIPLLENNENPLGADGLLIGGSLSINGVKTFPDTPPQVTFYDPSDEDERKYQFNHQIMSIAGRLARSLAVSSELDATPIFINQSLLNGYITKKDIAKNNQETSVKEQFIKSNNFALDKVQHLMHEISEVILPDEILNSIPAKEFIYARNNSFHECYKLRRKLLESINFLTNEDFNDEFIIELQKYLKEEVEPLIYNYQSKFKAVLTKTLEYSIPTIATGYSAIWGLQQALSPMAIAYLSGVSTLFGTATVDLAKYLLKTPERKVNHFSYFLNLRE